MAIKFVSRGERAGLTALAPAERGCARELDAVLFDAGGVLVCPTRRCSARCSRRYGGSARPGRPPPGPLRRHAGPDERAGARRLDAVPRAYVASVGVPADELDEAVRRLLGTRSTVALALPERGLGRRAADAARAGRADRRGVERRRADRGRPAPRRRVPGGRGRGRLRARASSTPTSWASRSPTRPSSPSALEALSACHPERVAYVGDSHPLRRRAAPRRARARARSCSTRTTTDADGHHRIGPYGAARSRLTGELIRTCALSG